jgi:hypothetical protein
MQTERARMSLMPSALVLCDLLEGHAGNPPREALLRVGFRHGEVDGYLARRAAENTCSSSSARAGR